MRSIRARRIENEWKALLELAELNPAVIEVQGRSAQEGRCRFEVRLKRSGGLVKSGSTVDLINSFEAALDFPEFFPAVPMEVFVSPPMLHPNVDPLTGFACVWDGESTGDSVIEALQRLQRVVCWKLFNEMPEHLMQPEALEIYRTRTPLAIDEIRTPERLLQQRTLRQPMPGEMRRRLS